jgi:hypothetical protein
MLATQQGAAAARFLGPAGDGVVAHHGDRVNGDGRAGFVPNRLDGGAYFGRVRVLSGGRGTGRIAIKSQATMVRVKWVRKTPADNEIGIGDMCSSSGMCPHCGSVRHSEYQ